MFVVFPVSVFSEDDPDHNNDLEISVSTDHSS